MQLYTLRVEKGDVVAIGAAQHQARGIAADNLQGLEVRSM
jgi:hypothetical protein